MQTMIGSRLANRYEILREIGRGGMGVVYLANDPLLEREVAIKIVTPEMISSETAQRFKREARVVAKMDHPGIVNVYDTGEEEGCLFFVMPYVEGTNLRTLVSKHSLSLGEFIDLAIQTAEALEYSHSRGIVHRDIKPENIMVTHRSTEGLRVRVMDFGLAVGPTHERITRTAAVVGTVAYMSPEQVTGKEIDSRSDMYSFGTVMYECLVGQTPFSGEIQALVYRISHELPLAPRLAQAEVDEAIEQIVMKCLDKDPAKRPTGREIASDLSHYRLKLETSGRHRTMLPTASSLDLQAQRKAARPFVGRDKEFSQLQHRLNAAIAGDCQLVLVSGEAGIGKSRLLEELENLARARSIPVFHGRFVEVNQALPYQGYCETIQEYFRTRSTVRSEASADFTDLAKDLISLFPVLAEVKELARSEESVKSVAETASRKFEGRTYIFELLARTLTRIAGGKPLILLFEDLHAANVSVEALDYIVRRLAPTPTLIVGSYRTTDVDKRHPITNLLSNFKGDKRFTSIPLGPLSASGHRRYLEQLIGGSELEEGLVKRFYQATEGNPYFTNELVRSLIDSGGIVREESGLCRLSSETAISIEELPVTIQQTVEERIERLPKDLREVVSLASVLGRNFEFEDLEILAADNEDLENAVEQLIHSGFIEEDRQSRSERLTFSSGVVRDVLYGSLPRRKRRSLHRKHAEELEKKNSGRLERVYAQLFEHYSQADVPEKVIEYGFLLARKSLAAFSPGDAIGVIGTVLDFLEQDAEVQSQVAEAKTLLAMAHRMSGNVTDALDELDEAVNIFERGNESKRVLNSILLAVEIAWQSRKVDETQKWIQKGLDLSGLLNDTGASLQLLSLAATVANLRGEYEKAQEYMEEAAKLRPSREEITEESFQGGTLVVAMTNPCLARHPANATYDEEVEVLTNIFETLVVSDEQGNLIPHLCERWETLNEGALFLFVLRKNVLLHDGTQLTSEVLKSSFEESIRRGGSALHSAFASVRGVGEFFSGNAAHVSGIVALSENIIQIQLVDRLPIYPALLTDPRVGIAARVLEPGIGSFSGTGPFKMGFFKDGSTGLQRNPNYWKGTKATLDAIDFQVGLTSNQVAEGFRSGKYDLIRDLHPQDLEEILKDKKLRAVIVEAPKKNVYFALFNQQSNYCKNLNVRQALSGIVRSHSLVTGTLGRYAQPAEGLFPPGIMGHDPGKRRPSLTRDQAIQFVQSAASSLPLRLRAAVHPILQDRYASFLKGLLDSWSEIGIEISIETQDISSYDRTFVHNEGIDVLIGRWIGDYDDPDAFASNLFHSQTGTFRAYVSSPEIDQLSDQARAESEPARRERLYRKFDTLISESAFFLPLFHEVDYRVGSSKVRKLTLSSNAPYVNYQQIGKSESIAPSILKSERGIITIPMNAEVKSLNPSMAYTHSEALINGAIYETLTRASEDARIIPWLVSKFQPEEGGRKFRFFLREGIRFHDGRRFTARDVRYCFEHHLQNQACQSQWMLAPIRGAKRLINGEAGELEGFRIISSSEFTVELEQPLAFFPAILAFNALSIFPEGTQKFGTSWRDGSVGTGPFRISSFEPGRKLKVEANPHYWQPGVPKADGVEFIFKVKPLEILSGFKSGKFSTAWELLPTDVESLRHSSESGVQFHEIPMLCSHYAVFNIHKPPFSDEMMRRRVIEATDVPSLVRKNLYQLALPAYSLTPPGLLGYEAIDEARPRIMKKRSGPEVEVKIMFHSLYQSQFSGFAQDFLQALTGAGFHPNVIDMAGEYRKIVGVPEADLTITRWVADYPDTDSFMNSLIHTKNGSEGPFCGSLEIDDLIQKGRTETDPDIRHSIYRQIEGIFRERALLLPLFHEQAYCFTQPKLQGMELSFFPPYVSYERLWIRR